MYKCDNCGQTRNEYFGLCPICKDGTGVLVPGSSTKTKSSSAKEMLSPTGDFEEVIVREIDPNESEIEAAKTTQFKSFNNILSSAHGFVSGQVVLMGASPGVGKSTLAILISDENSLYISSEENYSQVNQRALRVNPSSKAGILTTTNIDTVINAILTTEKTFIVIDSLNSIEFGVGYQTTARYTHRITKAIKDTGKIGLLISQVSKGGEVSGMNSTIHIVDTVLYMERSEVSSNIIATSSKNRYGEIGEVAVFSHEANGLEELSMDDMSPKAEVGTAYTKTRFGHKNMMICVESLVVLAQGSYGTKRVNGYNQNRFIQLLGILGYFGKLDFGSRDVYVSISNGLSTDDISIELAMAAAILSSFFKKEGVKEAYGEVKLNGRIVGGVVDGQKISRIEDLIKIYR